MVTPAALVLQAPGAVTIVTALGKEVLDLGWEQTPVFACVHSMSPRRCCGFVVTAVTIVTLMTLIYGLILDR